MTVFFLIVSSNLYRWICRLCCRGDVLIQTHLASRSLGTLLHVFETTIPLPRFAAFKFLESTADYRMPTSKVTFALKDSLDRMLSWAQTSFLTPRLLKVRTVTIV